jgi:hypothetical protein
MSDIPAQARISHRQILRAYRRTAPVVAFPADGTWSSQRRYLLTVGFGASYGGAVERLKGQAERSGWFDGGICAVRAGQVPPWMEEYLRLSESLRSTHPTGYGLWSWKPYAVMQMLRRIEEGAHLYYLDAGSEISRLGTGRMKQLDADVASRGCGFFELPFVERDWTKPSLLQRYAGTQGSRQVQATWFAVRNCATTRRLIEAWWDLCHEADFDALKDEPGFRHRHDQSVLSCLVHSTARDAIIGPWEDVFARWLYVPDSWVLLEPVHALRIRDSRTLIDPLVGSSTLSGCRRSLSEGRLGLRLRTIIPRVVGALHDQASLAAKALTGRRWA